LETESLPMRASSESGGVHKKPFEVSDGKRKAV